MEFEHSYNVTKFDYILWLLINMNCLIGTNYKLTRWNIVFLLKIIESYTCRSRFKGFVSTAIKPLIAK